MTDTSAALDPGEGYIPAKILNKRSELEAAVKVAERFYGDRFAAANARALQLAAGGTVGQGWTLACIYALLHRILEETDATAEDLHDAGLSATTVALLDAITAREGESPKQTALRAVTNKHAAFLLTDGSLYRIVSQQPPSGKEAWWPADPDARAVLVADRQRRADIAREEAEQRWYHYSLPGKALEQAGVPIEWANAVKESFEALSDPQRVLGGGYGGSYRNLNRHYDNTRVVRFRDDEHLIEVYQAGITPEEYETYVKKTNLTWRQIPAWHRAGLSVNAARRHAGSYGRNSAAAARALEHLGSEDRLGVFVEWLRAGADAEMRSDSPRPIRDALGWYYGERKLESLRDVDTGWAIMVQIIGSEAAARRRLDIARIVPMPHRQGEGRFAKRTYDDKDAHRAHVLAWDETGLPVERIKLLIRAGLHDPATALDEKTMALSDDQLQLAATLTDAN